MIINESICYIFSALILLILPIDWILSAATAALIHELFHILSVIAVNGKIEKIHISVIGCEIETAPLGVFKSIICILAGPIGSGMLLFLRYCFPMIAVCGFFQCMYNLLPVMPLDGGRILGILLDCFCPNKADCVLHWCSIIVCTAIMIAGIILSSCLDEKIFLLFFCLHFNMKVLKRKIPCKDYRIGLQWY